MCSRERKRIYLISILKQLPNKHGRSLSSRFGSHLPHGRRRITHQLTLIRAAFEQQNNLGCRPFSTSGKIIIILAGGLCLASRPRQTRRTRAATEAPLDPRRRGPQVESLLFSLARLAAAYVARWNCNLLRIETQASQPSSRHSGGQLCAPVTSRLLWRRRREESSARATEASGYKIMGPHFGHIWYANRAPSLAFICRRPRARELRRLGPKQIITHSLSRLRARLEPRLRLRRAIFDMP